MSQLPLQGVLVLPTSCLPPGRWQLGLRADVGTCPVVERFDLSCSSQVAICSLAVIALVYQTRVVLNSF